MVVIYMSNGKRENPLFIFSNISTWTKFWPSTQCCI